MPMKRMLEEGGTFGPKAVAILLEAFNGIVAELDLRTIADREKAAKIVIKLALGHANSRRANRPPNKKAPRERGARPRSSGALGLGGKN